MRRMFNAFIATQIIVLVLGAAGSATGQEDKQPAGQADVSAPPAVRHQTTSPAAVVRQWMKLMRANQRREAEEMTTQATGLTAQHDFPRQSTDREIRVERSLGNESVAAVVTNAFSVDAPKQERAFVFWLVRRDGSWLINTSYRDDPNNIEEQLRGFALGGGARWHVSEADVVGTWVAGPGRPGGRHGLACGSLYQLKNDGTYRLEMWGPFGPDDAEIEVGTWQLVQDRIVSSHDKQTAVALIAWIGPEGTLVLQGVDDQPRDGTFGTTYQREQSAERE